MTGESHEHINSVEYWDQRFSSGDWDRNRGESQARFFGALAVRLLPTWVVNDIKTNHRTVLDLGCAEGAGTVALSQALPGCRVVGVDFAPAAIAKARGLHRGTEFQVGPLENPPVEAEVLFLSNVLEHLPEPQRTLQALASRQSVKFLVVLVPLHEVLRHHEHVVTFDYNNFPVRLGHLSLAAFDEVDLRGTPDEKFWFGKQAFAVWAHDSVLENAGPTLQSLLASGHRAQHRLSQAQEQVRALEGSERRHLVELAETRRQLATVLTELRQMEQQQPEPARERPAVEGVQFLPDREAEARASSLQRRLDELESTLKWRWSNRVAQSLRASGLDPLLKLARSLDDVGVGGTAARLRRAFRRRLSERRRTIEIDVDPWVSLQTLKPIDVQVVDDAFLGQVMPRFSVVTTVRNEQASIVGFLTSIAQQRVRPSEVIVVDGGSTDATVGLAKAFAQTAPFRVEVVDEGPCNIAAGRNRGLQVVREEVVVFLDAGCTLRSDFFSAMVGPFARSPQTDLVGGIYVAAQDAPWARPFIPDWQRCDFSTYLPSARAVAVRPFIARAIGGFPEYLTHTGEDTLFDVEFRRASRHWVVNRAAVVEWSGPADEAASERLGRSYCRGDGESGLGDRRFYRWLSEFHRGVLGPVASRDQAAFEGYLEGRGRRQRVDFERRKLRGVVLVLDVGQLTDFGGDRRVAAWVTELARQRVKVVHVSVLGPDDPGARFLDLDQTLLELFHINDFDLSDFADRYGLRTLGVLVAGVHSALASLGQKIADRLPHVPVVLDEADHVAQARAGATDDQALKALRRLARARLDASRSTERARLGLSDGVDLSAYRRGLHERRPSTWPVRWKERVVIVPAPFDVSDIEGQFLRSVARACPSLGFVVLVPGWRFPTLASRWGVVEKNLSGTTWETPADLAAWAAHSSAVVLPWQLESEGLRSWAIGWARRAAALGLPSVSRVELAVEGCVSAEPSSFAAVTQTAVEHGLERTAAPTSWQDNTHRLLRLFFDIGR